jgi:hypothetical protein
MEHRLGRGGFKNWPKIKIDQYFFEIKKKIKIAKAKVKIEKKSRIRIKIEQ